MIEMIYMPLLNEGVDVWAPVQAESLGDSRFRVLGPMPQDQQWAFAPGSIVNARNTQFSGGDTGIAAYEIQTETPPRNDPNIKGTNRP